MKRTALALFLSSLPALAGTPYLSPGQRADVLSGLRNDHGKLLAPDTSAKDQAYGYIVETKDGYALHLVLAPTGKEPADLLVGSGSGTEIALEPGRALDLHSAIRNKSLEELRAMGLDLTQPEIDRYKDLAQRFTMLLGTK
jgi:hypothetical protein